MTGISEEAAGLLKPGGSKISPPTPPAARAGKARRSLRLVILSRKARDLVFLALVLFPTSLWSFPDEERAALALFSSQADSMVLEGDAILWAAFGDSIQRVDTETWALHSSQVQALEDYSDEVGREDLTGVVEGLAIRGGFLFASQADGDLIRIDLEDVTADPVSLEVNESSLGPLVADLEGGADDDKLYIIDQTLTAILVFDLSDNKVSLTIPLTDALGNRATPRALVHVPFPTASSSSSVDKVYVTTDSGIIIVILEGGTALAGRISLSETSKELVSVAAAPDGNFLFVVNRTDSSVHVIDTSSDSEVDTDPTVGGSNPIEIEDQGSLAGASVTFVADPTDIYAYVSGSGGLSVIDLDIAGSTFQAFDLLDFNDEGADDSVDDPLPLSSIPGLVLPSSLGDGNVFTSNSNATLSVVSDNPFVTIGTTSLTGSLGVGGTFTLTFQADEAGAYEVRVGGDRGKTGSLVASGTVDQVDTDVTTAEIAYAAAVFEEGTNRVFVFVEDGEGNVGHDAVDITVDTPPPAVSIRDVGFGSRSVTVTLARLDVVDIASYNVYVDTAAVAVLTKEEAAGAVTQPGEGEESVRVRVTDLENGITYFLAVAAVDAVGNLGTRTGTLADGTTAQAIPQPTVGITASAGETGCALLPGAGSAPRSWPLWVLFVGLWFALWCRRRTPWGGLLLILILVPGVSDAKEYTPQWWSLELKAGVWMPRDVVKDFLGCCEPTGLVEFGFLWKGRLGIDIGSGIMITEGRAVGALTGEGSDDRFSFLVVPIVGSLTFRADFTEDQLLVPFVKVGPDFVIFRENVEETVTRGVKYGLHGAGGLQILMDGIEGLSTTMEREFGVNDVYFVVEGRYALVDNLQFGGGDGLDLSNWLFSGGLLFEF